MNITIFARPTFIGNKYPKTFKEPYSIRLSSQIRGKDISDYLGGKYNPSKRDENDIIIHVKPRGINRVKDTDWVDFSDGPWLLETLKDRPNIKVIVHSQCCYEYIKDKLKNELTIIPQQHLNWENTKRDRNEITVAGYIGSPSPIAVRMYNEIEKELKKIGFDFITCFNYKSRKDAIDFYKKIDLLVIGAWELGGNKPYKTPTKMINAASFGIPSLAFPMIGYKEFDGYYVPINNMDEVITETERFKDTDYYNKWSSKIIKEAEKYHISKIANMYRRLK